MSNGSFNGVPLVDTNNKNSNVIFVPENTPHSYDADGNAIFYAWPAGIGDPPSQNQAPGAHAQQPIVWGEPKVVFNSSGVCTSAGYAPGNVWYNVGDQSGSPTGNSPVKTGAVAALLTLQNYLAALK